MDVSEWLRKLGLEQYEPAFRANEIDARVLPSLTAEDLKDLGVSLVGHRRRMLDAIAVLRAEAPVACTLLRLFHNSTVTASRRPSSSLGL